MNRFWTMDETTPSLPTGLTYDAYLANWQEERAQPLDGLDRVARRYALYRRYNWARAEDVRAAYEVSEKLRQAMDTIAAPQQWIVLTEDWCADSAYVLPVIAAAAARSEQVTLRILLRDTHPDVMDRYLTNGTRSIPKLVVLAEDGAELFTWGPRPVEAAHLRAEVLASTGDGKQASASLIDWYERGGWRQVDAELAALLETAHVRTADAD